MSESKYKTTFLSFRELFECSAKRCREAGAALSQQLRSMSEPYSYGMEKIVSEERELADMLSRHADLGPDDILNTRFQYKLDTQSQARPSSPQEAVEFLSRVNDDIARELLDQAAKAAPEDLRETLDTVAGEVVEFNRRISMIRVTMDDI